jgi:ferredoxin-nitrate reductase
VKLRDLIGTNPLVSLPDLPRTRKLLSKPNLFLIVQDPFLTETAAIADVVLPAAIWGEKVGTVPDVFAYPLT